MESNTINQVHAYISNIKVTSLFGMYDYEISPPQNSETNAGSDLIILYGDNGCGKTTILEIVFYLLSSAEYKGHKSILRDKPFRKFEVTISNGYTVIAIREGAEITGPFVTKIYKNAELVNEYLYKSLNSSSAGTHDGNEYKESLNALKKIGVNFHYLSQDRKLLPELDENIYSWRKIHQHHIELPEYPGYNADLTPADISLSQAVQRAVEWARTTSFTATGKGSTSANNVYLELLKSLSSQKAFPEKGDGSSLELLKSRLSEIHERAEAFSKYGLVPNIGPDITLLLKELDNTRTENVNIVNHVIGPYIDGLEARLAAQHDVQNLLSKFSENINAFFKTKELKFDLQNGIDIINKNGSEIDIQQLSSGEKQLLLIMCNAISSQDKANIFIIDEPEISLNIKWQRGLLKALLDCIKENNYQFILATHSLPLLSSYEENVVNLTGD